MWVVFTVLWGLRRGIPYIYRTRTQTHGTRTHTHTRDAPAGLRPARERSPLNLSRVLGPRGPRDGERALCRERETTRRPARREIVDFYPVVHMFSPVPTFFYTDLRTYGSTAYGSTDLRMRVHIYAPPSNVYLLHPFTGGMYFFYYLGSDPSSIEQLRGIKLKLSKEPSVISVIIPA